MEDGGSLILGLTIFIILLFFHSAFYCFMKAFENINESQIDKLINEGNKKASWLKSMIEEPQKIIFSLQILITCFNFLLGAFEVRLLGKGIIHYLAMENSSYFWHLFCYMIATIFLLIFLISVGIIAPQKIATYKSEHYSLKLLHIVRLVLLFVYPFFYLCDKLSNALVWLFRIDLNVNPTDVTEEELKLIVNEGHEQGILKESEAKMIHNIIEFSDTEAKDIMTHRKNMIAVANTMKLKETLDFLLEKNNTRFPVYEKDLDNIIGVIHIKDVMIKSRDSRLLDKSIKDIHGLVRSIQFIPETRSINMLFKTMQSQKSQMVIVVDEYGQTAGLVAMEDILEEIVGNILDEYDDDDLMIEEERDGSYLMSGMASFEEVCERLNIHIEDKDYETLNGYLISLIDKIPSDHELFEINAEGYLFQVLEVENKFIQTVKVRKIQEKTENEGEILCQDIQNLPI